MTSSLVLEKADQDSLDFLVSLWHRAWYREHPVSTHHSYRMGLFSTPWAREHLEPLVLKENGEPRSGLMALHLCSTLLERKLKVLGIAAVVTDPDQQGRGFASRLLQLVHEDFRRRGFDAALLFSDIGTSFYERLGYLPWPVNHYVLKVPEEGPLPLADGLVVGPPRRRDLGAQIELHRRFQSGFSFRLERTGLYWGHLLERTRLRNDLFPPEGGRGRRWIAWDDGEPVAYAMFTPKENHLLVTDAGFRAGRSLLLSALLAEQARSIGIDRIELMAPISVIQAMGLDVLETRAVDKMMLTPLGGKTPTASHLEPVEHCLWAEDWF